MIAAKRFKDNSIMALVIILLFTITSLKSCMEMVHLQSSRPAARPDYVAKSNPSTAKHAFSNTNGNAQGHLTSGTLSRMVKHQEL